MSIVARFYPNGEFTHGVDTSRSRKQCNHKQRIHEPLTQECRDGYLQWLREEPNADIHLCVPGQRFRNQRGEEYIYLCEDSRGHHYALEGHGYVLADVIINEPIGRMVGRGELVPLYPDAQETVDQQQSPLGLSNSRILKNTPSRKICATMTKHMARNIRNAAYLMERDYGKDVLSFLTLTVPNVDTDSLSRICANWDKIVHRFFMWLRKKLETKNIEPSWVYCTEIQPSRLITRGEYAPHLHILFRGKRGKKSAWAITPKMARKAWVSSIKSYTSHPFDDRAVENLQRIKKSAAGYLSKYMSKGSNSIPETHEGVTGITLLKTHWGGMSRNISRAVARSTRVIRSDGENGSIVCAFLQAIPKLLATGHLRYYKEGIIQISRNPSNDAERGLKVGCGCLFSPIHEGGLSTCLQFAYVLEGKYLYE